MRSLEGRELGAVYFVRDYVQLSFDGPILTCVTDPSVMCGVREAKFPDDGSRELLCSLIGEAVTETEFVEDVALKIGFGDAGSVRVSLSVEDQFSPEHDPIWLTGF